MLRNLGLADMGAVAVLRNSELGESGGPSPGGGTMLRNLGLAEMGAGVSPREGEDIAGS
ncbi:MAG: hypothetical protein FWD29_00685 [Micrococcales bacterium]|nr:hypothetical protein [Micrococcales bacterium]